MSRQRPLRRRTELAGYNAAADRIAVRLWRSSRLTKKQVLEVLEAYRAEIVSVTDSGKRFGWPQFGVFVRRTRKGRKIRNPQTHEIMWLEASTTLSFRAAKRLKAAAP